MKKIFILLGLILVVTTISYSQQPVDTIAVSFSEVYKDAAVVSSTVYADAKDAIKELGAALKVGSEHVYKVLVKQQYVKAIPGIIFMLFFLISGFIFMKYIFIACKNGQDKEINISIIFGILSFIFVLCLSISENEPSFLMQSIQGIINPEYGAMTDIINMIEKIRK